MNDLRLLENELVPVYETDQGIKVVNGRELHQVLQSKQDFSTWVKKRLSECDALENEDFDLLHNSVEQISGTKHRIDYLIKLDIAKEMAMLERNEKGKEVRRYFIRIEKKYKENIMPKDLPAALRAYADEVERRQIAEREKENLQKELDYSKEWLSIKRVAAINNVSWKTFQWRKLKEVGEQMGYGVKKIFDANYGEVNTYHRDVWEKAYPDYEV